MSEVKKDWSKPVLKKITPAQAIDFLLTKPGEASATRETAQASATDVGVVEEMLRQKRHIAELTQELAECRELLAERNFTI